MARVPRDRTGTLSMVMNYTKQKFDEIQKRILDEQDSTGRIDTTYQTGLDAEIKSLGADVIKMLRWLIETNLSLSPPSAFTNTQVDAINPDIRTYEDGT